MVSGRRKNSGRAELGSLSSKSIVKRSTLTRLWKGKNGKAGKGHVIQLI